MYSGSVPGMFGPLRRDTGDAYRRRIGAGDATAEIASDRALVADLGRADGGDRFAEHRKELSHSFGAGDLRQPDHRPDPQEVAFHPDVIEAGKLANVTVLGQNPLRTRPSSIQDIRVWGTIHEGRVLPRARPAPVSAPAKTGGR